MRNYEQRVIGLSGNEMVDHIDGGRQEDLDVGIASGVGYTLGQKGFARPGIANEHDIHVVMHKVEVEQVEDARFLLLPGLVVAEVEPKTVRLSILISS